jgi:hypothetical protein
MRTRFPDWQMTDFAVARWLRWTQISSYTKEERGLGKRIQKRATT